MKLPIPVKEPRVITPGFWYIIWEKSLLKPRVLKYAFRGEYFAQAYAEVKLSNYKYNILRGETLIEYGLQDAYNSLRSVSGLRGGEAQQYKFPDELHQQRKKTLRTMYRRNMRRLLAKLMKYEYKKPKKIPGEGEG